MSIRAHIARLTMPVGPRDHPRGPLTAPVTLVEYGDFECPFCGAAYPVVNAVVQHFGDRLCFAFRNFPLTTVHPHAEHAAEAAEAAGAQGKFWKMHDMLFEHQQALDAPHLIRYAQQIGLDTGPFAEALRDHRYASRVREDFLSGVRSGVNGTPTFFLNGIRYDGSYELASMIAAIRAEMPD
ncbi:MAG: thioredoxin domain-containing protein [Chloroflexi bacterium]|nr:thioredoxin domain-containing protein [Chloroflexota bacterium]